MSSSWLRVLGLIIVSSWLAVGCSQGRKIEPGGWCIVNRDCAQFMACTWGKCHDACHTTADCAAGQSCITASDQSRVCQLPSETQCAFNSDCSAPLICAVDQQCRNQCQGNGDCPSGQICTTTQTCAEPSQVDPNNNLIGSRGGVGGSGGASGAGGTGSCPTGAETCSCFQNGTCNAGLTCASHLCVRLGAGGGAGAGGGLSAGGAVTAGGAGGTSSAGGAVNTGGSKATGSGGTTGTLGGLSCTPGVSPSTPLITDFSPAEWNSITGKFGTVGNLTGSVFSYAAASSSMVSTVDTTNENFVLSGNVAVGGWAGGGLAFDNCVNTSTYTGVQFRLGGTAAGCDFFFLVQTFSQQATTNKGGCTSDCYHFPMAKVASATGVVTVHFADVADTGVPAAAADIARELVGLQWQFQSPAPVGDASQAGCTGINLTIDDVSFVSN